MVFYSVVYQTMLSSGLAPAQRHALLFCHIFNNFETGRATTLFSTLDKCSNHSFPTSGFAKPSHMEILSDYARPVVADHIRTLNTYQFTASDNEFDRLMDNYLHIPTNN